MEMIILTFMILGLIVVLLSTRSKNVAGFWTKMNKTGIPYSFF